ncbi:hypothetical protein FJZ17_00740 [Candidatus Pacearchaeota archaeon]|nr:hypothetical protein [Candidatus Pacearchaeota archaeon]
MRIDFYAEFPEKGSLGKLKLLDFKSRVFIGTKSLAEFHKFQKQVIKINKKIECCYWPKLKNSYWISGFSDTNELEVLFKELSRFKGTFLMDLELPLLKPVLFFKNLFKFNKNKRLISNFMKKNSSRIMTAQYPFKFKLMGWLGLDYPIKTEKSPMYYSSLSLGIVNKRIRKNLLGIKAKTNYTIGLGTISRGIFGFEKILLPELLEKDLEFVKKQVLSAW